MRGRGIFIGVELVRLCASSRKCDSIIEGGGWGEVGWGGLGLGVRWWWGFWRGVGGVFKKASAARGHLGRKEKTRLRNRMEPC